MYLVMYLQREETGREIYPPTKRPLELHLYADIGRRVCIYIYIYICIKVKKKEREKKKEGMRRISLGDAEGGGEGKKGWGGRKCPPPPMAAGPGPGARCRCRLAVPPRSSARSRGASWAPINYRSGSSRQIDDWPTPSRDAT